MKPISIDIKDEVVLSLLIYFKASAITDHSLASLSMLNLAFAGLVDGSFITTFLVAF